MYCISFNPDSCIEAELNLFSTLHVFHSYFNVQNYTSYFYSMYFFSSSKCEVVKQQKEIQFSSTE